MRYFMVGLFLFTSCKKSEEANDIIASFPSHFLNYTIAPKCEENNGYFNKDSEIVTIDKKEFNSIIQRFKNLKSSKEIHDCSSDFSFLIGEDKYCSCIYEERLITKNGKLFEISDTLLFDIKSALTYYNSRPKEDLKYDPLIQKFGLPKNYKYQVNSVDKLISLEIRLVTLSVK